MMYRSKEEITYEFFGIDPAVFYAGKFASPTPGNLLENPVDRFHFDNDRAKFLVENVIGKRVLDIGCGSAPYGNTIRANTNVDEIYGVDFDFASVEIAKSSYDSVSVFDLGSKLPFEDEFFDCVFSMDVWGYIEFKSKDHLLREIHRVTRKGGRTVHGIECGVIDYFSADPSNPDCPIKKYVLVDGHVGVESAGDLMDRWSKYFCDVSIRNSFVWPLRPFGPIRYMDMPAELKRTFDDFSKEQIYSIQLVLGYLNGVFQDYLLKVDSNFLFPAEEHPFRKHSGFVYLVGSK